MDDIQILVYLIIGIIYIISRALKGKNKSAKPPQRPAARTSPPQQKPKAPSSFEEILAEFGKRIEEERGGAVEIEEEEEEIEYKPLVIEEDVNRKEFQQEGRNRQFADEESRRVYEEAIVRAEGADLAFEADANFQNSRLNFGFDAYEKKEKDNKFAREIRSMLQDGEGAKKAVILAEILNRKY